MIHLFFHPLNLPLLFSLSTFLFPTYATTNSINEQANKIYFVVILHSTGELFSSTSCSLNRHVTDVKGRWMRLVLWHLSIMEVAVSLPWHFFGFGFGKSSSVGSDTVRISVSCDEAAGLIDDVAAGGPSCCLCESRFNLWVWAFYEMSHSNKLDVRACVPS